MTNFLKQTIKNQVALTIEGKTCKDLKTYDFDYTEFFKELKYFIKSDYAKYIKEEKEEGLSKDKLKDNINYYWGKFQLNIRYLNLT